MDARCGSNDDARVADQDPLMLALSHVATHSWERSW